MEFHHLNYIVISQKTDMSGTVTSRENVYQFPEYLGYPKTIKRDDVDIAPTIGSSGTAEPYEKRQKRNQSFLPFEY